MLHFVSAIAKTSAGLIACAALVSGSLAQAAAPIEAKFGFKH